MAMHPNLLDLRPNSQNSTGSTSPRPLRSPRLHVTGEIPPEFSPLDAFVLQSRILAKQLQESTKEGNRFSRLPPLTVESPLIVQGRSNYFRSMSQDSGSEPCDSLEQNPAGLDLRTEVDHSFSQGRPKSIVSRTSRIPPSPYGPAPAVPQIARDLSRGSQLNQIEEERDSFGARRERSPSPKIQTMHLSGTKSMSKFKKRKVPVIHNNGAHVGRDASLAAAEYRLTGQATSWSAKDAPFVTPPKSQPKMAPDATIDSDSCSSIFITQR
ncbi:hypothetical protein B0J13DRAFT_652863 [Dactylonectria estremocensis]|uniref:Uncharacterized protein n=1 Tax=Dactylonectria estremocensis TaxID=1079267 RepID=A0A9P9DE25_9HYPO|nr:hypothetical protein B0J13DRAFT_652863 [Dactylonectria estremocensis]